MSLTFRRLNTLNTFWFWGLTSVKHVTLGVRVSLSYSKQSSPCCQGHVLNKVAIKRNT